MSETSQTPKESEKPLSGATNGTKPPAQPTPAPDEPREILDRSQGPAITSTPIRPGPAGSPCQSRQGVSAVSAEEAAVLRRVSLYRVQTGSSHL
jgi:hypothetical protein